MVLKNYLMPLLRWWWLLIISTVVATVSSYYFTRELPPYYQSQTTLMIGSVLLDPNPNSNEFNLSRQLSDLYVQIARRDLIRDAAATALGLTEFPEYEVLALPGGQFVEITVTDVNPIRAQAVANELANQLIKQSPTSIQEQDLERQTFINEQLVYLEEKIEETEDELATKQLELAELVSAWEITEAEAEIVALQDKLLTLQANYASLIAATQRDATNTLMVIEPAMIPTEPAGPNKTLIIVIAGAIGLTLASGAAYLLEFFDDTIRTAEDVTRIFDLTPLGFIAESKELRKHRPGWVMVAKKPHSLIAEAFRSLRTNLEFVVSNPTLGTILISSPGPTEGKSTVAINLAASLCMANKRVLLVDADIRRPSLHRLLGIPNDIGLTEAIEEGLKLSSVAQKINEGRLQVVTGGKLTEDATELFGSVKMLRLLATAKSEVDVVIFDGPPVFVSDANILASRLGGVILVVQAGRTREATATTAMEQLKRADSNVLGVVLNRVPRSQASKHVGAYYLAGRFSSNNKDRVLQSRKVKPTRGKKRFGQEITTDDMKNPRS